MTTLEHAVVVSDGRRQALVEDSRYAVIVGYDKDGTRRLGPQVISRGQAWATVINTTWNRGPETVLLYPAHSDWHAHELCAEMCMTEPALLV